MEEQDDRQIGYVEGQDDEELKDYLMMSIQRHEKLQAFLGTGWKLGKWGKAMERPCNRLFMDDLDNRHPTTNNEQPQPSSNFFIATFTFLDSGIPYFLN